MDDIWQNHYENKRCQISIWTEFVISEEKAGHVFQTKQRVLSLARWLCLLIHFTSMWVEMQSNNIILKPGVKKKDSKEPRKHNNHHLRRMTRRVIAGSNFEGLYLQEEQLLDPLDQFFLK